MPEWEELRSLASAIKEHTLTHLGDYLEEFEQQRDRQRHGRALGARRRRAQPDRLRHPASRTARRTLVKSKSMLTDECEMRPFLENRGIEIIETDLGERIQQLDDEPPSHIVVPAVHKLRGDVAEVFGRTIGTDPKNTDVHYLAESQRQHTRPYYLKAQAGMTGANFAIAETGSFVVCTNEGNADLGANLPTAAHRLDRHREAAAEDRAPRRLRAHAVAQRARLADHADHLALPRAAARHRDARRAGRQRPLRAPRHGGLLVFAQVHPLRRLHEHLPGVPAQRRPELRLDLLGADRRDHRPDLQPAQIQLAAVRLDAQRQLHQRVPGEDQHPRADLQVAPDHRRAPSAADGQEGGDARRRQDPGEPEALSRRGRGRGGGRSSTCRAS